MIHQEDLIVFAGGLSWERFGTPVRQTSRRDSHGSLMTCTRAAATATSHDRQGILTTWEANQPRLHWVDTNSDGVMDTACLLIEPTRTNLALQSGDISTSWTNVRSTDAVNQVTGVDGTTSGDELIEDATATDTHHIDQAFTGLTADASYAASVYGRANTRDWIQIVVRETAASTNTFNCYFDLATGAVGTAAAGGTGGSLRASITRYGDWYRCAVVGTVGNSSTANTMDVRLATGDGGSTYSGDGSSSVYLDGFQFEDNAQAPSSQISTTTVAVTRNADQITLPYYGPLTDITLFAKFVELGAVHRADFPRVLEAGATPHVGIYVDGSNDYRAQASFGSTVESEVATPNPTIGQVVEALASCTTTGATQLLQSIDAGAVTAGAESTAPPGGLTDKDTSTLHLGGRAGGASIGQVGLHAVGVVRGTGHTIADLRALLA